MTLKELGQIRDVITLIKMSCLKAGLPGAKVDVNSYESHVKIEITIYRKKTE